MVLQATEPAPDSIFDGFDICIAGAGAAGIALAVRLIHSGKKVLLLAAGQPEDKRIPDANLQRVYEGAAGQFLRGVDPIFLHRSRLHMYGGTTNHFGFWSRPLDPADFAARKGYRAARWPITLEDLRPFYSDAHAFGNFGPFDFDNLPFWERVLYARSFPSRRGDALQGAIMHAQYDENLHDFQVQFGPALRAAQNVTVLFNAHVQQIETDAARGKVTGLRCATLEGGTPGRAFHVRAGRYVLALGGIENARMLQHAGNLGDNTAGHLGRGFMVHPLIETAARVTFAKPVPTEIRNFFREQQIRLKPPAQTGGEHEHMAAPLVNPELVFDYRMFNAWGVLAPTARAMRSEGIGNFRIILRFSPDAREAAVNINWEQAPNENSAITLNPAQRDPVFGNPVAKLDWHMADVDKKTAQRGLQLTEAYLRRNGADTFTLLTDLSGGPEQWTMPPSPYALATGDHHMGATRMAARAQDGIVNADCRMHAVKNLYVAGCSVFPTGGYANPTLTIVALALRLADHLKV